MKNPKENRYDMLSNGRKGPFESPWLKEHFIIVSIFLLTVVFAIKALL